MGCPHVFSFSALCACIQAALTLLLLLLPTPQCTGGRASLPDPMPRRRTVAPRAGGMLVVVLLLGVVGLVGAEPGKWGKSAVFIKGKWTQFDENDEAGVPQPYPPWTDSWMQNDTSIMVSISSFRDYRCPKTLYNLFTYVFWGIERGGICMSYTTLEMCARSHISARSHPRQKTRGRAALGQFEWGCLCVRVCSCVSACMYALPMWFHTHATVEGLVVSHFFLIPLLLSHAHRSTPHSQQSHQP